MTRAKLGFDPIEVNPEDMLRFAQEDPHTMAQYSVRFSPQKFEHRMKSYPLREISKISNLVPDATCRKPEPHTTESPLQCQNKSLPLAPLALKPSACLR